MEMRTYVANGMRDIEDFVNEKGITKDQILSISQNNDGTFVLYYFESK